LAALLPRPSPPLASFIPSVSSHLTSHHRCSDSSVQTIATHHPSRHQPSRPPARRLHRYCGVSLRSGVLSIGLPSFTARPLLSKCGSSPFVRASVRSIPPSTS